MDGTVSLNKRIDSGNLGLCKTSPVLLDVHDPFKEGSSDVIECFVTLTRPDYAFIVSDVSGFFPASTKFLKHIRSDSCLGSTSFITAGVRSLGHIEQIFERLLGELDTLGRKVLLHEETSLLLYFSRAFLSTVDEVYELAVSCEGKGVFVLVLHQLITKTLCVHQGAFTLIHRQLVHNKLIVSFCELVRVSKPVVLCVFIHRIELRESTCLIQVVFNG